MTLEEDWIKFIVLHRYLISVCMREGEGEGESKRERDRERKREREEGGEG